MRKPLIVGESNPYGGDDYYALYPAPDGCSGHRLCCRILGMDPDAYLEVFGRTNLVRGPWRIGPARERAKQLWEDPTAGPFILLGAKVCAAWDIPFKPFEVFDGGTTLVLPHPSGINRMWGIPGTVEKARAAVATAFPEVAAYLGADRPHPGNTEGQS
jgi:hypothetical protein